ncbi:SMC-Scp complex subunit ScpB [Amycolatopsis sp. DG1A-15b]|uniref:SMC-Scp complex subunit ScpB n=1 Tax=Amycolatopsis sp. DG1A-15b TaxID=3052846 RepID=UPI00255BF3C5|nr:SMC-Scp complex subunit ScpB [Amycolatopsis sp. DG1A-15b]WIX93459.1 SMC-Scp complex subunit ScpB [Amycolatopsis sp. DG1A-15b]
MAETPEAPEPPTGEPEEAAAELALDEALSGEPVTEDGDPVEPLTEAEVPVAEAATEPEVPVAETAAGAEVPVAEAATEPEVPVEEAAAEPEVSAEEAAAEPEVPVEEAAAEPEAPVEETAPELAEAAEPAPADPASGLVAAGDADAMPDVTSDEALEAALEALLLIVDSPAGEELLADTLGQPKSRIVVALRTMAQKFTDRASGIDLRRVGEGWRFYTRDVYAPFVEKLLLDGQRSKLTRAALESLAVIAYRQPVTRARVAAVRGVNVDGVIRTLLARGLIEEMGTDPETTGTLYVTTELFLERLGLSSLNDLPAIAPLLPEVDTIDDIQ